MSAFQIGWLSGALTLLMIVGLPVVGRFVSAKLAMFGAAVALVALWSAGQIYPIGLGVCAGVLFVLWLDYRQRRRCPGCGAEVERSGTLCESCRASFDDDLNRR
ncbi:MAG: hypothetical protein KC609_04050 [Myxococcales bacterium]|nr:hypothetical protein [Myxococcales bacterium]